MWISCSDCSWIALTTSGWQWPVEQTATPALQSRNTLPSTSSTQTPLARSATSLNDGRGYDGLTNLASASTIFLPFGPGNSVLISGLRGGALTPVDMFFLLGKRDYYGSKTEVFGCFRARVYESGRLIGEEIRARIKR